MVLVFVMLGVALVYYVACCLICFREILGEGLLADNTIALNAKVFAVACCFVPVLNAVVIWVAYEQGSCKLKM